MAKKEKYKAHFLNDIFIDGVLRFPKLNEPDDYGTKPAYKTGIIVEATALAALKKKLVAFAQPFWPGADLWLPIKRDKKDESIIFVEASTKKVDDDGVLIRPVIVDAKRKPISQSVEIGGGSIAKIKCTGMDYEGTNLTNGRPGVALILETVQIKKLKTYRDPLAGFGDEEGYSVDGDEDIEHADDSDGETSGGDAYDL
jgi:hypothetical protein